MNKNLGIELITNNYNNRMQTTMERTLASNGRKCMYNGSLKLQSKGEKGKEDNLKMLEKSMLAE